MPLLCIIVTNKGMPDIVMPWTEIPLRVHVGRTRLQVGMRSAVERSFDRFKETQAERWTEIEDALSEVTHV